MSFFEELKRRNVFRVGIAYAVAAWVLLQVVDLVLDNLAAPDWVMGVFMLAVALGFPISLIIAWAYEITPDGIKRESEVDRSQSISQETSRKLDRIIIGFLVLALGYFIWESRFAQKVETEIAVAPEPAPEVAAAETAKSIAVLPFVNMSSDPEQEYFSDGLSEELLNRLSKNDQLHVAARTSAFQFKGQNLDISDIGRQLHVAHVLEGSVRKAGNRLRITAQLIQVDNGFHLWSETYEREIDDIFAIQDDISQAISRAMEIELGTSGSGANTPAPTSNLEAYNFYLQARYFLAQRGEDNMLKANHLFEQAVALDPDFSSAWSGMAFNTALLWDYGFRPSLDELKEKTLQSAKRAIELDPSSAEAYSAIGRMLLNAYDWQGAMEHFERAYELGPHEVGVLNLYGDFQFVLGNIDLAIKLRRQAIDLDPLAAVHAIDLAGYLLGAGQHEAALVSARRGVSLAPDLYSFIEPLIEALLRTGNIEEARALIEQVTENPLSDSGHENYIVDWWAAYYFFKSDIEKLRQLVAENIQASGPATEDNPPLKYSTLAFYSLWLDGPEAALPWLEKAYENRDGNLTWPRNFYLPEQMSTDPAWLEFWEKPELKALLEFRRANPDATPTFWKPGPGTSEVTQ